MKTQPCQGWGPRPTEGHVSHREHRGRQAFEPPARAHGPPCRWSRVHARMRAAFMVESGGSLGENPTVAEDALRHVKDGHSLAHAIVDTVREALIVLDPDLRVVAAS